MEDSVIIDEIVEGLPGLEILGIEGNAVRFGKRDANVVALGLIAGAGIVNLQKRISALVVFLQDTEDSLAEFGDHSFDGLLFFESVFANGGFGTGRGVLIRSVVAFGERAEQEVGDAGDEEEDNN